MRATQNLTHALSSRTRTTTGTMRFISSLLARRIVTSVISLRVPRQGMSRSLTMIFALRSLTCRVVTAMLLAMSRMHSMPSRIWVTWTLCIVTVVTTRIATTHTMCVTTHGVTRASMTMRCTARTTASTGLVMMRTTPRLVMRTTRTIVTARAMTMTMTTMRMTAISRSCHTLPTCFMCLTTRLALRRLTSVSSRWASSLR